LRICKKNRKSLHPNVQCPGQCSNMRILFLLGGHHQRGKNYKPPEDAFQHKSSHQYYMGMMPDWNNGPWIGLTEFKIRLNMPLGRLWRRNGKLWWTQMLQST
jgi:hypothetical protein